MRACVTAAVWLVLAAGCGDDGSGPDWALDGGSTPDVVKETSVVPDTPEPKDETPPPPDFPEDFAVAFVYRGIIAGDNTDKSDLYLVDSHGRNPLAPDVNAPIAITTFGIDPSACQLVLDKSPDGTPVTTAPCSCNLGCVVDKSLTWIAVTVEKPSQTGFVFQVGKFNADLEVKMVKGAFFKNIVDLAFAGSYLYFSQVTWCADTGCTFLVYRFDLNNIPAPQSLFQIPPEGDPDLKDGQTITDGHFTASADGSTLAFLSPTIRSQRVYVWRAKGGEKDGQKEVKQLEYLCPGGFQDDHCTGSGSEFSDLDPLSLSVDGKKLAWISRLKDRLELHLYDTDMSTVKVQPLMDTAGKDYASASCQQIEQDQWKFNKVANPLFSEDAQTLFFVASSNCDATKKPFTDVVSAPLAKIGTGPLTANTLDNLTNNPRTNDASNAVIEYLDLSPGGGNVVYTASPSFGQDKSTPLPATSAKAKQSKELWVASTDGKQKRQITFNTKYSAVWLTALPPVKAPGR